MSDWRNAFRLLALRIQEENKPVVMSADVEKALLEIADMDDDWIEEVLVWPRERDV